jgi:hypothetical protein
MNRPWIMLVAALAGLALLVTAALRQATWRGWFVHGNGATTTEPEDHHHAERPRVQLSP